MQMKKNRLLLTVLLILSHCVFIGITVNNAVADSHTALSKDKHNLKASLDRRANELFDEVFEDRQSFTPPLSVCW